MTEKEVNELITKFVHENNSLLREKINNKEFLNNIQTKWFSTMRHYVERLSTDKIIWTLEADLDFCLMLEIFYLLTSTGFPSASQKKPPIEELIRIVFSSIINKLEKKVVRHRIVGKWFNMDLSVAEWELENGDFIPTTILPKARKMSLSRDILPDWYVFLVDKAEHRNRLFESL